MNSDAHPKYSFSTAKIIMDLANFIAFFLASVLSIERLVYWQGHKKEMKAKLRKVLKEVFVDIADEFADVRANWEAYYLKAFKWTMDFSEVVVPPKPEGEWRLIFVAKGLNCDKVYAAWTFPKWKYVGDGSIDAAVPTNIRTATEHYAVWVRDGVEPDAEFLGKSTKQVDTGMKIGMTLLERMVLEGKYFDETGKHLDIVGVTFCSGSRDAGGDVPGVGFDDSKVRVDWYGLDDADAECGVRRAVST
jgi:hypothetical protein